MCFSPAIPCPTPLNKSDRNVYTDWCGLRSCGTFCCCSFKWRWSKHELFVFKLLSPTDDAYRRNTRCPLPGTSAALYMPYVFSILNSKWDSEVRENPSVLLLSYVTAGATAYNLRLFVISNRRLPLWRRYELSQSILSMQCISSKGGLYVPFYLVLVDRQDTRVHSVDRYFLIAAGRTAHTASYSHSSRSQK